MSVEDLEKAVENLPPSDLARFRAWFDAFDAARFDERFAQDAASGKLDKLADAALAARKDGRVRDL